VWATNCSTSLANTRGLRLRVQIGQLDKHQEAKTNFLLAYLISRGRCVDDQLFINLTNTRGLRLRVLFQIGQFGKHQEAKTNFFLSIKFTRDLVVWTTNCFISLANTRGFLRRSRTAGRGPLQHVSAVRQPHRFLSISSPPTIQFDQREASPPLSSIKEQAMAAALCVHLGLRLRAQSYLTSSVYYYCFL
jgi:hypothetical protein